MPKVIYDPAKGPMRVLAVCSGRGQAAWAALDLQKELGAGSKGCPFEVIGLFSDRPASRALEEADRRSLPKYLLDAAEYHRGEPGQQMSAEDNLAFEQAMMELISPARADCLLVDGYQWTIGRVLLNNFSAVRIWPGGPPCLKNFFKTGEKALRAKTTFLTAPGGLGPVMITAPPVYIDYGAFSDEKSGVSLYLPSVMEQSGRAGARAVEEISLGHFSVDADNLLYYNGQPLPDGLVLDRWS